MAGKKLVEAKELELIYEKIEEALKKLPEFTDIKKEFVVGSGARLDYLVHTQTGKSFVVEVKMGHPDVYLSVSSYPQLVIYRKLLQDWHKLTDVVPIVITNQRVNQDLAKLLADSQIAVAQVKIKDTSNEIFLNVKQGLARIGQWVEDNKN